MTYIVSSGALNSTHSRKIRAGNSADKLRHPRSDAYSAEHVLLNKQQISGGGVVALLPIFLLAGL